MKSKIKKIMFYKDFLDNNQLLFTGGEWYNPVFQTEDGIVYLIAKTGEKLGIDTNDNPNLFCLQKEYKK